MPASFANAIAPYCGRLLIGCSGGADSLALAHACLLRHRDTGGKHPPILLYIDHGLRPESKEEGRAVAAFAERLGGKGMVRGIELSLGAALEKRARDARYEVLEAVAAQVKADWILLGHTRSDQEETILMRILRGTGLVGLAGIPKERGKIARPLLNLDRADIEEYCQAHQLSFANDVMNQDLHYTRVRVRRHWLPELRNENPKVGEALCRLAAAARDHREVMDFAAQQFLARWTHKGVLTLTEFADLPRSLAVHVLNLHALQAGVSSLEARHLGHLLEMTQSLTGSQERDMPGALVRRSYEQLEWNPPELVATCVQVPDGHHGRVWQRGDRMRPKRLLGRSRKLSDLYADAKIAKHLRAIALVVEEQESGEIVWAEHIGPAWGSKLDFLGE